MIGGPSLGIHSVEGCAGWPAQSLMHEGTGLMDDITYVGLDVHKATVCMAVAESGRDGEVRQVGVFENRPEILCKVAARLGKGDRRLSFCYEAGPCGYGLHRLLTGCGHSCIVVAPSLIPMKSGDRVKTDRRDAMMLAKLHRGRADCDLDPRCRARSCARPGAGASNGRASAVQGAAACRPYMRASGSTGSG